MHMWQGAGAQSIKAGTIEHWLCMPHPLVQHSCAVLEPVGSNNVSSDITMVRHVKQLVTGTNLSAACIPSVTCFKRHIHTGSMDTGGTLGG